MLDFIGGADGDRTHDLMNAIHALSQLSYSPTELDTLAISFPTVNIILTVTAEIHYISEVQPEW